ncbi:TRAP transporter small permease [Erythrobacteraceae bacterium WH01K]|nr:TRAP transporter small permease [Erythrobacteraceae bacterium WH01K]
MLLIRLGALGLVAMTAIIGWQVFGRFVLNSSPSWTEQASLILMIWYVMFAAAAGVYEGFHIRIALLEEKLGERAAPARRLVAAIVMLLGLVLLIYGAELCWLVRDNVVPSLGVSRSVAYFPMPLSGLLMALFAMPGVLGRASYPAQEEEA